MGFDALAAWLVGRFFFWGLSGGVGELEGWVFRGLVAFLPEFLFQE